MAVASRCSTALLLFHKLYVFWKLWFLRFAVYKEIKHLSKHWYPQRQLLLHNSVKKPLLEKINSNETNNYLWYFLPSILFGRLNKPLLHAPTDDKSLHPALTGSVINRTITDCIWDWTVCLYFVTLLPWYASRFTQTKSGLQTHAVPRTSVSSLRHLFDSLESLCGPCAFHRWPKALQDRFIYFTLKWFQTPTRLCVICGAFDWLCPLISNRKERGIWCRLCIHWQHITTPLFIDYTVLYLCSVARIGFCGFLH